MKKIPSFTVDHIHLLRGIYVSRKDAVGDEIVTTFDINHPVWADKIIYWGPMGCLTGNYLVVKGDLQSEDIVDLMKETFRFISGFEGDVPGASPKDCGNYLMMNLPMARWEAKKFLDEVLDKLTKENLNYPQ